MRLPRLYGVSSTIPPPAMIVIPSSHISLLIGMYHPKKFNGHLPRCEEVGVVTRLNTRGRKQRVKIRGKRNRAWGEQRGPEHPQSSRTLRSLVIHARVEAKVTMASTRGRHPSILPLKMSGSGKCSKCGKCGKCSGLCCLAFCTPGPRESTYFGCNQQKLEKCAIFR